MDNMKNSIQSELMSELFGNKKANRKLVQAQYLKVGDKLRSGGVVTNSPYVDINTPSGKVKLGVNGYLKVWNKRTEIAIIIE